VRIIERSQPTTSYGQKCDVCARKTTPVYRDDLHASDVVSHRLTHQPPLRSYAPPRPTHGRWAACDGRSPDSRLGRFLQPSRNPHVGSQWRVWRELAAYSCGGSLGIGARAPHRVPIFTTRADLRAWNRHIVIPTWGTRMSQCGIDDIPPYHLSTQRACHMPESAVDVGGVNERGTVWVTS